MNTEKFPALEAEATNNLQSRFDVFREHAEHFVHRAVEKMKDDGRAIEFSDDEERMLRAYRAFVSRSIPGAVFSWKSPTIEEGAAAIAVPAGPPLIMDPREVVA